jgi:Tol biopolymer transport system component
MIVRDDFDRLLTVWLDESAGAGVPDYLDETLDGLARIEQRRAWMRPWRWLSVQLTMPRVVIPRALPILALLILLIVALLAAALLVGSRPRLPAPFGAARSGLVAFDSEGDIYVAEPDGTGRRLLFGGPDREFGQTWSRDGTRLAFWSADGASGLASLWLVRADGSDSRNLTGDQRFQIDRLPPAVEWSPAGDELAFASTDGGLYILTLDSGEVRRIGDQQLILSLPTWSPDGSLIAFRGYPPTEPENFAGYVIHPDGSGQQEISPAKGDTETTHILMSWAPGSDALLYHTGRTDRLDIAVSRKSADGTWHESLLIGGDTDDYLPVWSTDGGRLAWLRVDGLGTPQETIHVMVADADGTNVRRVTDRPVEIYPPCWSPDDRMIRVVMLDEVDRSPLVGLMAVDGSQIIEIPAQGWSSVACPLQRLAP